MVSNKYIVGDGTTRTFLSDVIIKSELYCRVYNYVYDAGGVDGSIDPTTGLYVRTNNSPIAADTVTLNAWTLVDNYISFYTAPQAGTQVVLEVATNPEELGDIVAGSAADRAETAATNAETSETNAAASATAAATSASDSSTSATNSANSATASATSATASATSATAASTSATNAATSETNAATSATNSANSATASASSATDSANSATASANSATAAATSATNAETAYDNFDDRYLGAKASDPTLDNDGDALITGALYFNTTSGDMKVYTGSVWQVTYNPSGLANVVEDTTPQLGGALDAQGNDISNSVLSDVGYKTSIIGNVGATRTFDYTVAQAFTATVDQNSTFTFSNPPVSGTYGIFKIILTNGGAFTVTWPTSVDWDNATAPTLTAAGVDILSFETTDAGTTWVGRLEVLNAS